MTTCWSSSGSTATDGICCTPGSVVIGVLTRRPPERLGASRDSNSSTSRRQERERRRSRANRGEGRPFGCSQPVSQGHMEQLLRDSKATAHHGTSGEENGGGS